MKQDANTLADAGVSLPAACASPAPAPAHGTHDAGRRRPLRVTVLCGGPSAERAVSLDSGRAVADALRRRGHTVFVADIAPGQLEALDTPADVVFPALHGTFGEDGTVQEILAARGLRFVGSDARASAIAIDKVASKHVALAVGAQTPGFEVWTADDLRAGRTSALEPPLICKPVDQGSSVGTSIVRDARQVPEAVAATAGRFGRALVERFITGEELTVGLLGDQTLPPICIRPKRAFYDYDAKYRDDATEYLFDAGYSAEVLSEAAELSRRIFRGIGCRHMARVDWIVAPPASGRVDASVAPRERLWFLEINTIPGFTNHSLVPKAAARVGIEFDELVERLVFMALQDDAACG